VLGKIWYVALTERLKPGADFVDFARATTDIAGELYGNGGEVQRIIAGAWSDVGLKVPALRVHVHGAHPQSQAAAAGCRGDRERFEVASASRMLTLEGRSAADALGALLSSRGSAIHRPS
jgi:Thermolysin metallopeptidase, alpha-helical domain